MIQKYFNLRDTKCVLAEQKKMSKIVIIMKSTSEMKSSQQIKLVEELKMPFVADVPTTSINPDCKQELRINRGCHWPAE